MLLHAHVHNIHADNCMADLVNICTCRLHCNKQSSEQYYSLPSGPCIQWGGGGGGAIAPVCTPLATGLANIGNNMLMGCILQFQNRCVYIHVHVLLLLMHLQCTVIAMDAEYPAELSYKHALFYIMCC